MFMNWFSLDILVVRVGDVMLKDPLVKALLELLLID